MTARERNMSSGHDREAPAGSGFTATDLAFGVTLGTGMLIVTIIVVVLWAKLVKKGTKLRRVELELEAVRGPKSSDCPGADEDREHTLAT